MTVETGSYISSLNSSYPASGDAKREGDNHICFIKAKILDTFIAITRPVTATHTELNYVDGVTSAIQTQLDAKGPLAPAGGAIGSYVFAKTISQTIALGATISGGSLTIASAINGGTIGAGSALSGTWQCMGYTGGSASEATLYLRIS